MLWDRILKCLAANFFSAASLSFVEVQRGGQANIPSGAFDQLQDAALSPDGHNLYTVSGSNESGSRSGTLTAFKRDPMQKGSLSFLNSISHTDLEWLTGPRALAISGDGQYVYVLAWGKPCIVVLKRDKAHPDDALHLATVIESSISVPLRAPSAIAMTQSVTATVYVTDYDNDALLIFQKPYLSESLTIQQVFQSSAGSHLHGDSLTSAIKVDKLSRPNAVAFSKGTVDNVYVSSSRPDGIAVFLCSPPSYSQDGHCTYANFVPASEGVSHLAAHPSGLAVFVVSQSFKSLTVLKNEHQGKLSNQTSFRDGQACVHLGGLHLAVKDDAIVVAGGTEDTLSFFHWDDSVSTRSALSYQGSVKDGERLKTVAVDGLANVRVAIWSSDMTNLYTISRRDKAVAVFASEKSLVGRDPCSSRLSYPSESKSTTTQTTTSFEPTTSFESADASESSDVLTEKTANAVENTQRMRLTVWLILLLLQTMRLQG